jgi:hypothetical protein
MLHLRHDTNARWRQAHQVEERSPGEPCAVGSKNGERISFDCP